MQVQQPKYAGLVADLLPNIRLMQTFGHFIFRFITGPVLIRRIYSSVHLFLILFQFLCILMNLAHNTDEVSELTCKQFELNLFAVNAINLFQQRIQSRPYSSPIASQSSFTLPLTRTKFLELLASGTSPTLIRSLQNQTLGKFKQQTNWKIFLC